MVFQKELTQDKEHFMIQQVLQIYFSRNFKMEVISISAKEQFTKATSPYVTSRTKAFFYQNNQFSTTLTREKIIKKIQKNISKLNEKGTFNSETQEVTLIFGTEETKFSLTETEDFIFFAEIISSSHILSKQVKKHLTNCCPTFYNLIFTSLKGLAKRYSTKSSKYVSAAQLLDSFIPKLISKVSKAYQERVISQVVLLGGLDRLPKLDHINKEIGDKLLSTVEQSFPHIYLTNEHENRETCDQVKTLLNGEYKVSCSGITSGERKILEADLVVTTDLLNAFITSNSTTLQIVAIADWQTWLWTAILLTISVILAVFLVDSNQYDDITSWIIIDLQEKNIYEKN